MKTLTLAILVVAFGIALMMSALVAQSRTPEQGGARETRETRETADYYRRYLSAARYCRPFLDERHEYELCLRRQGF